jgi:DNA repair protein RecN (Recombination protein N)
VSLVADLAMEETRFEVRFQDEPIAAPAWSSDGIDAAEFFVSPNPGEELRPLARIVSGGELSRIMLAIKTLTATSRHGFSDAADRPPSTSAPGLIFDEVDAGIGGRVADVVGRKLRALGSAFQVLCITHLPQIAASADTHFQIEKRVEGGRTRTTVRRLDAAGRVEEIGRMLGGELTDGLLATAREMLADRGALAGAKGERKGKGESESPSDRTQRAPETPRAPSAARTPAGQAGQPKPARPREAPTPTEPASHVDRTASGMKKDRPQRKTVGS